MRTFVVGACFAALGILIIYWEWRDGWDPDLPQEPRVRLSGWVPR